MDAIPAELEVMHGARRLFYATGAFGFGAKFHLE